MQAETAQGIDGGAIFLVADDGMVNVLHMYPDLVLSPRFQVDLQ